MKKAGVAVDDWKLPVFRRRLKEAGYEYRDAGPIPGGCTLLHVPIGDLQADQDALQAVLEACQAECRKEGKPDA